MEMLSGAERGGSEQRVETSLIVRESSGAPPGRKSYNV